MEDYKRNRVLLVLFIGVLMGALDIAIIGPALPSIQRDFGLNDRTLGWTIAIYVLFNLIGTPLMAKLSDLLGRRPIYLSAVTLFALGSVLVAVCPNFGVLLIGRSVQGFGSGGIFPVAVTIIGETFPAHRRGRTLGLLGAVFGLAFLIGPILGGILLMISWRLLFIVNLPVALLIIILSLRHLPAGKRPQQRSFDLAGMALLAGFLISLAFGLEQLDTAHLMSSLSTPFHKYGNVCGWGLRGDVTKRGGGDARTSTTTRDKEIARNLHPPGGLGRDGPIPLLLLLADVPASPRRHASIWAPSRSQQTLSYI